MKTDEELRKIAKHLIPAERLFFKHGQGWMLTRLSNFSRKEYKRLEKIVEE